ncbi:hypothetical protein ABTX71_30055 [Streptomyces parvulus]|uniref:TetR/AcrR family transcriptional regulator n=1 Tax=Streptomyces parvulus TaxID=146923 RepID=UPI00331D77D0
MSIGSLYQYFPNKDPVLAELLVRHIDRGAWMGAEELDMTPGSLEDAARSLVRDAIDHHRDDPQLLQIMIEEAPVSSDLIEAIDRHGKVRVSQVREVFARHPDVRVRDLDMAAELIVGTAEMNTHKRMATPTSQPGRKAGDGAGRHDYPVPEGRPVTTSTPRPMPGTSVDSACGQYSWSPMAVEAWIDESLWPASERPRSIRDGPTCVGDRAGRPLPSGFTRRQRHVPGRHEYGGRTGWAMIETAPRAWETDWLSCGPAVVCVVFAYFLD